MAAGQGTAPAVPHSLVAMPPGSARAHTKTRGQIATAAATAALRVGEAVPQGYTANNCSFSIQGDGGGARGEKKQDNKVASSPAFFSLPPCLQ